MFNSLRSRLWLTYALIILMVVAVVMLALIITLRESSLLYRQMINELEITTELWARRLEPLTDLQMDRFLLAFSEETGDSTIQAAIVDEEGVFLTSNIPNADSALRAMGAQVDLQDSTTTETSQFRDTQGNDWFYRVRTLGDTYFLLTAVEKPIFSFSTIAKDEFMGPVMQAGLIVIVFAFFISLIIGNWIALPLKRMSQSAEALSEGDLIEIPLEGPKEVRRLANTFNLMSKKITASSQSQREFIANVSHEFKTPLTSIQGFAQAILDGTVKSKKEVNKAASVILIETNRLHRLMMDLLMLARLEAGTANMQQAEVSIRELLGNMMDKFSLQAEQQGVNLSMEQIPDGIVSGDGDRLAQVFSNLIDNALKYTSSGGKIEISAGIEEKNILICIRDSGIGISKSEREKIFERFYQIDSSRKYGKKKGFGLGLSIAREIIQSHHGTIWVESSPDEGSTFFVKLPMIMNKS
ncbi:MAG: sensor histidine kinase [Anaerolineaceae bacterium]